MASPNNQRTPRRQVDAFRDFQAAVAHDRAGRRDRAEALYRKVLQKVPDHADALHLLGIIAHERGRHERAIQLIERAIAIMPDFPAAHLNLGNALRAAGRRALAAALTELGRFNEALACHQRAIALQPSDALLHESLGDTLYRAQQPEASEARYRHALSLNPDLAWSWHGLGNTALARGRLAEATSCFRRALAIAPDLAAAYEALAFTRQCVSEEALVRLGRLAVSPDRPVADQIAAEFALGAFLDNGDRYDAAFPHFAEGNTLSRQQLAEAGEGLDPDELGREVDGLIERCTPELFAAAAGFGSASELPVFIVGMPRSGTSLVEQIAASHSRVFGAGELKDIARISEAVLAHNRDKPIEEWDMDLARELADEHVAHLQALGGGAARVIDKMPDNILHLGIIAVLFPGARVIFCRRDARDTCVSCFFLRFGEGHAFAYDLADCGRQFLEIERLADHWRRVLPLSMLTVDYEVLVADPEGETRRLIEFLGLGWEPACLEFHRTERPVFTAASWEVRQPIYRRSIGRWRHYERHLGPLLEVLSRGGAQL
jgi:tetratricopeptide (TPR) repeat protein